MIQFQENAQTEGQIDRSFFIGPLWLTPGVQKKGLQPTDLWLLKTCFETKIWIRFGCILSNVI